ncbi:MAG TPA: type II toxin-antitoxin system RelE/ParE family toxin [Thermoanaerobaculia bacterium]
MRLPVSFTPRADRHADEATAWWRENRTKAPNALVDDLADALELISTQPYVGAIARNVRLAGIRRVYLSRTGHYLYYRVRGVPAQSLEVVALWHASRRRGPRL